MLTDPVRTLLGLWLLLVALFQPYGEEVAQVLRRVELAAAPAVAGSPQAPPSVEAEPPPYRVVDYPGFDGGPVPADLRATLELMRERGLKPPGQRLWERLGPRIAASSERSMPRPTGVPTR